VRGLRQGGQGHAQTPLLPGDLPAEGVAAQGA